MDLIWSLIASERFWNLRQLWASPPLPCPWNMLARTKGHVFCSTLLVILSCESPFQTLLELISMCSACVCWDMWQHSGFLDMDTMASWGQFFLTECWQMHLIFIFSTSLQTLHFYITYIIYYVVDIIILLKLMKCFVAQRVSLVCGTNWAEFNTWVGWVPTFEDPSQIGPWQIGPWQIGSRQIGPQQIWPRQIGPMEN